MKILLLGDDELNEDDDGTVQAGKEAVLTNDTVYSSKRCDAQRRVRTVKGKPNTAEDSERIVSH